MRKAERRKTRQPSNARLWWIVAALSLGPAVTNGFARFAYGLILPAMRDDLGWNFTEAGWINTANAIGYLLGALLALATIGRFGPRKLFVWGMALTTLSLVFSAITRDIAVLSALRIAAGIGGAPVFIAGGAMASAMFAEDRSKNALALAVYFGGGGFGMVLTAASLPLFIDWFGPPGWPLVWLMLGVASWIAFAASFAAAEAAPVAKPPAPGEERTRLPVWRMLAILINYTLFGLGYVIYITFLIAWMRDWGASAELVALTWGVMGVAVSLSAFLWRYVLALSQAGGAAALTTLMTGIGAILPVLSPGPVMVLISAFLFGGSFFMVPTAGTNFVRKNLAPYHWGPAISFMTVVFAIGQIIGPVGAGALADHMGGTTETLIASGAILVLGAAVAMLQRPLKAAGT